jgi:pimeloyl-ACP methyl ester carboxylesterase
MIEGGNHANFGWYTGQPNRSARWAPLGWIVGCLLVVLVIAPYVVPLPGSDGMEVIDLAPDAYFVEVDGERVHVRHEGPADGPAVVLIHGVGGSTFSWRRALPRMTDAGFRVLAMDLRGFGLSDKSFAADHSIAAQADLVARVVEAVGIDRASVVGHSMGGGVAVHLALARPELVDRLVLVNAWVPPADPAFWPGELLDVPPVNRWARLAVRSIVTPARVSDVLRPIFGDPEDVVRALAAGHFVPVEVRGWDEVVLAVARDVGRDSALTQPLTDLRVPTLIVWGARDPWLDLTGAERLRAEIPSAELVLIPDAGHLPFEEQPERFLSELLSFLQADRDD